MVDRPDFIKPVSPMSPAEHAIVDRLDHIISLLERLQPAQAAPVQTGPVWQSGFPMTALYVTSPAPTSQLPGQLCMRPMADLKVEEIPGNILVLCLGYWSVVSVVRVSSAIYLYGEVEDCKAHYANGSSIQIDFRECTGWINLADLPREVKP